jgi:precorrin-6B methylase 2
MPEGMVFAIEKNGLDLSVIRRNIEKFHAYNVRAVKAYAPDGLNRLPDRQCLYRRQRRQNG